MKRKEIELRDKIEAALTKLLNGDKMSVEAKEDLRKDCLLAMKWEAIRHKTKNRGFGSAFGQQPNGKADDEEFEEDNDDDE